jgi:hypothetical protein
MRVAGSYSWRIFCASRFAGMTTRTARSPPASCADWTLFQQGIVELRSIRAEGTEFRLLDAGQPFAALTLVRARRAGPCHIAQALDGQLSSIDTKPGEHLVQQLFRAGTSCDQRLNLRARGRYPPERHRGTRWPRAARVRVAAACACASYRRSERSFAGASTVNRLISENT